MGISLLKHPQAEHVTNSLAALEIVLLLDLEPMPIINQQQ